MIIIMICAVLSGCDDWVDVSDWCEEEEDWLKTFLVLTKGTPSHDTFGEVFRILDAKGIESCFRQWISVLSITVLTLLLIALFSFLALLAFF